MQDTIFSLPIMRLADQSISCPSSIEKYTDTIYANSTTNAAQASPCPTTTVRRGSQALLWCWG